jgi:uncharacterized protein YhjY with autotransporter beta-barrel domain
MAIGSVSFAQTTGSTVILEEGREPTAVQLGMGDDRVVVDILRVNADTGVLNLTGLTNGPLTDDGGKDSLWLRATTSQTRDVVFTTPRGTTTKQEIRADSTTGTPFDGGTVYEASGNDTVLTLENRSRSDIPTDPTKLPDNADMTLRHGPLRLAGDGKVILTFTVNSAEQPDATQQAIRVEEGASTPGGDGKLDLVLDAADVGGDVTPSGLIDVQNAASLRLSNNSRVQLLQGVGILGGNADIFLDANTWVNGYGGPAFDVTLIESSGRVYNSTRVSVAGQSGNPNAIGVAVKLANGKLYNTLTEGASGTGGASGGIGNIIGGSNGVIAAAGDNYIENVGDIRAFTGAAIRSIYGTSVVRNTVWNFSKGGSRAGEIVGGLINGRRVAYQATDGGDAIDFVVNSGTITGDIELGESDDMFLYTGATNGVTGAIVGGTGIDGYGRSFSTSTTQTLGNDVLGTGNSGFEMHGIEARGTDTTVTVASVAPLNAGLMLVGDGIVVNTANINLGSAQEYGVWARAIANVDSALRFVNRGQIETVKTGFRGRNGLASFTNEGRIYSSEGYAVDIDVFDYLPSFSTLTFNNSGTIESGSSNSAAAVLTFDWPNDGLLMDFVNTGTIRNTGEGESFYGGRPTVIRVQDYSAGLNRIRMVNDGTIEATGRGAGVLELVGAEFELVNSKVIRATGIGSIALAVGSVEPGSTSTFVNSGTVSANGGEWVDGRAFGASIGTLVAMGGYQTGFDMTNAAGGTIEATGTGSVAVYARGQSGEENQFTITNRGTLRGAGDTVLPARALPNFEIDGNVLAGAIHTFNTIDVIRNEGVIEGSIDLGSLNDEIYNGGTINGDVRLGDGSDSYIIAQGGTLNGAADGGTGFDTIRVDLTGDTAKKINASQFTSFEAIAKREGTSGAGKVSVFGTFGAPSMLLGTGFVLHVDQGDTVASANGSTGATFVGDDGEQQIDNAGTIAGGLVMGAGNDTVTNSGTIGFNVSMGDGDDIVTNSGTIKGNLNLGGGNDRYEALGGTVTGSIDGGAGDNDIFVFRMNGNDSSIPGGFVNFESFGAYGPGTLTLALDQDYNTIELLERANLTLNDGTGKIGLIKGDDTAQVVTINDADFDGSVSLGGGDDTLAISLNGALSGELDGGAGTDTLNLNLTGDSTINDLYNFEIVNAAGASPLTLQGTLGAGQQINFDGSDNHFIVDTGAVFEGTANGGAGTDTFETISADANSRTIVAGQITSFERLIAGGLGTLELRGAAYSFDSVEAKGNLTIGDGASLASGSGIKFNTADNKLTLEGTGAVNSPVDGDDGTDTLAFKLAQGQTRNLSTTGNVTGFERLAAEGAGMLNIDQSTDGYRQLLLGDGASVSLAPVDGGHATIAEGVTFSGDVGGNDGANSLTLKAGATLDGDVYMNGGNDVVSNAGTIDGNLDLGNGDDRYIARAGGVVTGTIDGGAGDNIFVFNLDGGNGAIPGSVLNFNSFGAYGPGTLTVNLDAGQTYNNLEILEGANLVLSGTNGTVRNVIGDDSAQSVTIDGALTGGVSLGGGDDSLTMQLSGLLEGALDGGAGTDTLNLNLTGASSIAGMYGFEIANISGASPLTLTGDLGAGQQVNFTGDTDNELIIGAGVKFEGTVNGGAGRDLLRVQSGAADSRTVVASQIISFEDLVSEGEGTLALTGGNYSFDTVAVKGGNFELGENTHLTASGVTFDDADNRFTLRSGATVAGAVAGGEGNDTLALIQNSGATRLLSSLQQSGFERLEASGAGELNIDEDATYTGGVFLNNGTVNVLAGKELTADVMGGAGADTLIVGGSIDGNVDLGDGDDTLTLTGLNGISGTVTGGAGTDRLRFNTSGTYAAPTAFDGSNYSSFEAFDVAGGVVSIAGTSSWDNVSITGGRLIGQAGSVITSSSAIQVTHGATFGSAGIVNADINVAGTLSPGASPGTMTVNGNVNFAAGSNLLIEVSPTLSDLLNISGKLTIAAGAAIDITGVLQGTPGNMLDLVVAQGGITGRFTTINKSADVFGFVVQNGNKLQIQSEFLNDDAYPTNVQASVDYANEVLRGGYGVQAFTAGLPVLVDAQGVVNHAAFGQLTPEAYGSAIQLGAENSLSLVDGVHSAKAAKAGYIGLYSFGQFLTGSAGVNATGGNTGASRSHLTRTGFFGGIGYGFGEDAQVGIFFGGLDSRQTIGGLGAKTDADALAGGIFADAKLGGFGVHGLLAFNGGKAKTHRQLAVTDSEASAKYDLNSWVADLGVDYQVKMGAWSIAPKLGVTYVHTSRGAAVEQGAGDFGLTIDKGSKDILFGEAAVNVSGTFQTGGIGITPYAQIGVRQMLSDGDVLVSGHFTGADSTIVVNGIEREKTAVRVAVGLGLDLTDSVRVQAGYAGEFAGTKRNSVMGGLSVRF